MHYLLAVIHNKNQSIENLMEPFYEGLQVKPHIIRTKAEIIEEAKKLKESNLKRVATEKYNLTEWERQLISCKTDEDFYNALKDEDSLYNENGDELSIYNPFPKWDWYEVGGRWNNLLKTKNGTKTNSCYLKELDLKPDTELYADAIAYWEKNIEGNLTFNEFNAMNDELKKCYVEEYGLKENFAKLNAILSTHAVLDYKGQWHEPEFKWDIDELRKEEIKWHSKYYDNFLKNKDNDLIITIVDYHM